MPFSKFIIKEIKHYYNYDNHGNANNHLEIDNSYFGYNFSSIGTIYETIEYFEKYRFGFNGQEKDDEVNGAGNTNTALFWEYDTRLGRRWNLDPVVKPHESPYACFANNPIWFVDPNGDDSTTYLFSGLGNDGKPQYTLDEMQKIADFSKKLDRLNGVNYTKFQVYETKDAFLEAHRKGDVKLNPLTDLVFEIKLIDPSNKMNLGETQYGTTNAKAMTYNGVDIITGEIYMGAIDMHSKNHFFSAGKVLSHERWTHGYMFIIAHKVLCPFNNYADFKPTLDNNVRPNDIASNCEDGSCNAFIDEKTYPMLRSTEMYGQARIKYVNNLFLYDKYYKNYNFIFKTHYLNSVFVNKSLYE